MPRPGIAHSHLRTSVDDTNSPAKQQPPHCGPDTETAGGSSVSSPAAPVVTGYVPTIRNERRPVKEPPRTGRLPNVPGRCPVALLPVPRREDLLWLPAGWCVYSLHVLPTAGPWVGYWWAGPDPDTRRYVGAIVTSMKHLGRGGPGSGVPVRRTVVVRHIHWR